MSGVSSAVFSLHLRVKPAVLIDARNITPDRFAGRELSELRNIVVLEGGRKTRLSELFDIDGPEKAPSDPGQVTIVFETGSDKLCFIGYRMSKGRIVVKGDAGHLVGYRMRGGSIVVEGSARDYVGAKMRDGTIEVYGSVGHRVGGKLPGEKPGKGMKGGTIAVRGNAGSEAGFGMERGVIIIEGSAGNLVGADMLGGSVVVKGDCGLYPGAGMSGGRVVVGGRVGAILPSFYADSMVPSISVRGIKLDKPFMLFIGDVVVGGKGLLYVSYDDNRELLSYYKSLIEGEGVEV
uniref:formylmethanofuran dehydrogenase n=1 Tax=Thermofilum pendens TaxID=2269 RepID=A0A7C1PLN0_THEPE